MLAISGQTFRSKGEAAAQFNVSTRTIDRWAKQVNGLPFLKAGSKRWFCDEWTAAWLTSRKMQLNPARRRSHRTR